MFSFKHYKQNEVGDSQIFNSKSHFYISNPDNEELTLQQMLKEIAFLTANLDPQYSINPQPVADSTLRRINFLGYEIQALSYLEDFNNKSIDERLAFLNHHFFVYHRFSLAQDSQKVVGKSKCTARDIQSYFLHTAIARRCGANRIMSLIYSFLAEKIGINISFVDIFMPDSWLKISDNQTTFLIDLSRSGKKMDTEDLLQHLEQSERMPAFWELTEWLNPPSDSQTAGTASRQRFIQEFLLSLKLLYTYSNPHNLTYPPPSLQPQQQPSHLTLSPQNPQLNLSPNPPEPPPPSLQHQKQYNQNNQNNIEGLKSLLLIQDALMKRQPSNLRFLVERALIYRKMGELHQAYTDLKRYFSLLDLRHAPADIVMIFNELKAQLEKQNMEIMEPPPRQPSH